MIKQFSILILVLFVLLKYGRNARDTGAVIRLKW
jgi:hypothetical protein